MQVKAITPRVIDPKAVKKSIDKEKKAIGKEAARELSKTVKTWQKKPKFKEEIVEKGPDEFIVVDIDGDEYLTNLWKMLDAGAKPHPIQPHNPWGRLFFRRTDLGGSYSPKTKPGEFTSADSDGVDVINPLHAPPDIIHPGFEARDWVNTMLKLVMKTLGKREMKALKNAIEKKSNIRSARYKV